jgi:hypothetical protein
MFNMLFTNNIPSFFVFLCHCGSDMNDPAAVPLKLRGNSGSRLALRLKAVPAELLTQYVSPTGV